ncbi:MAG TPA: HAMP domain-containing sensor histidine kinase [Holophagaceae bacterium]|nr:HAMP domain-containing sensor histidine kinase [Holophagaceae bacterium]
MTRRQLTTYRRLINLEDLPPWRRWFHGKGGTILLLLAGLALGWVLKEAPNYWVNSWYQDQMQVLSDSHFPDLQALETGWKSLPLLAPFEQGSERSVQAFLDQQPLVEAVFDRFEHRRLWMREGNRLLPAKEHDPLTQRFMDWIAHAEAAQRFQWNPPREQDPDFGRVASVVLLSDRWMVIKRWRPGSEEVERALRIMLPLDSQLQVGLYREGDEKRKDLKAQPWGDVPHRQADPYRLLHGLNSLNYKTTDYGDGWSLGCVLPKSESEPLDAQIKRKLLIGRGLSTLVALVVLLGFWLRYRTRQKALLDADRMASLTHSLKTPLAILKFRCDTLRLGRLSPDEADAELMKLGQEVDHLTLLIENGLRALRGDKTTGPMDLVDSTWIREVVDDLRPGYEMENRELDLRLGPEQGRASHASLRSAILTLVENALLHGSGRVTVETARHRDRLVFRVKDEGEGLNASQLAVLGKPFQRIRKPGKEGFLHEGQGLGLSLLSQVAEREGWGLAFDSAPGQGFTAELEIRRA